MGTVLCKLFRYILCNIFVAYERGSKYCVSFRFVSFRFVSYSSNDYSSLIEINSKFKP